MRSQSLDMSKKPLLFLVRQICSLDSLLKIYEEAINCDIRDVYLGRKILTKLGRPFDTGFSCRGNIYRLYSWAFDKAFFNQTFQIIFIIFVSDFIPNEASQFFVVNIKIRVFPSELINRLEYAVPDFLIGISFRIIVEIINAFRSNSQRQIFFDWHIQILRSCPSDEALINKEAYMPIEYSAENTCFISEISTTRHNSLLIEFKQCLKDITPYFIVILRHDCILRPPKVNSK